METEETEETELIHPVFRAPAFFTGHVFGERPWFGTITRAAYQDGVPTEAARLSVSGWVQRPLSDLADRDEPDIAEAQRITRDDVIAAFGDSLDPKHCDPAQITPESPARPPASFPRR